MQSKGTLQNGMSIVSAEGTEDFGNARIAEWKHLVDAAPVKKTSNQAESGAGVEAPQSSESSIAIYENVFDTHDGRLKIIQNMPGGSKAEKTRNTALTLLFGEYLTGNELITAEQLKSSCIDQGCYDPSNFASHLKSLKEKVVLNPKPGGDYTIKLTAPGRRTAKDLVTEFNSRET